MRLFSFLNPCILYQLKNADDCPLQNDIVLETRRKPRRVFLGVFLTSRKTWSARNASRINVLCVRVVGGCTPDSGRFPYGQGLRATLSGRYRFVLTKPAGVGATLRYPDEYIGMP